MHWFWRATIQVGIVAALVAVTMAWGWAGLKRAFGFLNLCALAFLLAHYIRAWASSQPDPQYVTFSQKWERRWRDIAAVGSIILLAACSIDMLTGWSGSALGVYFCVYGVMYAAAWMLYRRGRANRSKRVQARQCEECGYDLTGNVSGTCPECATPVPGRAADAAGVVPTKENEQG